MALYKGPRAPARTKMNPERGTRSVWERRRKTLDSIQFRWKKERQMWWWHFFVLIFVIYLVLAITAVLILVILQETRR